MSFSLLFLTLSVSVVSADPLNTGWLVLDNPPPAGVPVEDGTEVWIYYSTTGQNGLFTEVPSIYVEDRINGVYQNPIKTGDWNTDHPKGIALCDLKLTAINSYHFYIKIVTASNEIWYWPYSFSTKPGDPSWEPVTSTGSPTGYAASGNGMGNGVTTVFKIPGPYVPELPLGAIGAVVAPIAALAIFKKKKPASARESVSQRQ